MREENYISYKAAQLLKQAGYQESCEKFWTLQYCKTEPMLTEGVPYDNDEGPVEFDWNRNSEHGKLIGAPYPNVIHKSQCSAPTLYEAQKWIRKQGIMLWVSPNSISSGGGWAWNLIHRKNGKVLTNCEDMASEPNLTFDEALEEGTRVSLQLLTH